MPILLTADMAFARCPFSDASKTGLMRVPSARAARKTRSAGHMMSERRGYKDGRSARKFLCFAQNQPKYSGGSTGLTDFLGVTVSPSISQRNCCGVRRRTSSVLLGHWKRLSESLLYNRSHPSPSHPSPLMRSVRRPQKR